MKLLPLLFTFLCYSAISQNLVPSSVVENRASAESRQQLQNESLVLHLPFKNIGPSVISGRVTDVAVDPTNSTHFYVAYASGGLWETTNNGMSFTPLFDNESTMTIGAIAVDWENNKIVIGTGEVNSSRSSYAGDGIYISMDNGKSWKNTGLNDSHHIGKIIIDENNPEIINVAVLGHLYSPNKERGMYHSVDGGESWEQALFVDENTGVVDLVADTKEKNVLYAAAWHRERRAWNFVESGQSSGIYKSIDNGRTWRLITSGSNGFPISEGTGRIGLATGTLDGSPIIYALLDNYDRREKDDKGNKAEDLLQKDDFKTMDLKQFKKLDDDKLKAYLKDNRFPKKYTLDTVRIMIDNGSIEVKDLAEYLEDANRMLFDTEVKGAELYISKDGGISWKKTHEAYLNGVYYSYGYYFGFVYCEPTNANNVYIGGVPLLKSEDGGKSFKNISQENVHADHHSLWINPSMTNHLINGNDGGINISYDSGEHWIKCNSPAVAQIYAINVDMATPYNVYCGMQDNGVWMASHDYKASTRWHASGHYPYEMIMGGDGMQIQIDNRDNTTKYTGYQFGNYFRIDGKTNKSSYITPKHALGYSPYRWNWQSPILLSTHNQDIVYMGANKLFRSFDQGNNFDAISEDLTKKGKKGDVSYGTLTSVDESELQFGLIYTGSDDGQVNLTKDGGVSWDLISDSLPQNMWVSRVQASTHVKSRVYLSLNAYRWDNFDAMLYKSDDMGTTWQSIGSNLPKEPINVIKEDPVNEDILYVGTDNGLYVSLNRGEDFMAFGDDIPAVAVHDIVVHPRDHDLIIGTHGRSMYLANISNLQVVNEYKTKEIHIFSAYNIKYNKNWGKKRNVYAEITVPNIELELYAKDGGEAILMILDANKKLISSQKITIPRGLSIFEYNLAIAAKDDKNFSNAIKTNYIKKAENDVYYLQAGEYTLQIKKNGVLSNTLLNITDK